MNKEKLLRYSYEKNEHLKKERNIGFEEVILAIKEGMILDDLSHPNSEKYAKQRLLILSIKKYTYIVPYVESESEIFLKTIIPSRKMNKLYNNSQPGENQ